MLKKPSTLAWIAVHLVYPFLPVPLEGFFRLVVNDWSIGLDTFSASTLAVSAGLMSVFVNQSLRTLDIPLPDGEDTGAKNGMCTGFICCGVFFFAMFAAITLMDALVHHSKPGVDPSDEIRILHAFQVTVFITCLIPVIFAVRAQKAFKLRASLG